MPQLDKYIFFHQITSLTIIFFLIYIYTRKTILPNISAILKFRSKLLRKIYKQNEILTKTHKNTEIYFSSKAISYILEFSKKIFSIFNNYENTSKKKYIEIYDKFDTNIKSNEDIYKYILKLRKEKKRNLIL